MKIGVWCTTHQKLLDSGIIDSESSLLLWNDFTTAKEHLHCEVMLRLLSNCPRTVQVGCKEK